MLYKFLIQTIYYWFNNSAFSSIAYYTTTKENEQVNTGRILSQSEPSENDVTYYFCVDVLSRFGRYCLFSTESMRFEMHLKLHQHLKTSGNI